MNHGNKQVKATPVLEGQLDESQLASHTHAPISTCHSLYKHRPQAQQGGSLLGTQRDDTPALCCVHSVGQQIEAACPPGRDMCLAFRWSLTKRLGRHGYRCATMQHTYELNKNALLLYTCAILNCFLG